MNFTSILFLLLPFSILSFATHASLIPENDLHISIGEGNRQVGESVFHQVIDSIESTYAPVFTSIGVTFSIERLWEQGEVNAAVAKKGNHYRLRVYGGLARFAPMKKDPLTLVLCHEIGHLIGGAPTWKPQNHVSSEGQADYYSTLKCFRKLVAEEDHFAVIEGRPIHPLALDRCGQSFDAESESYAICLRSSVAIEDLSHVLVALREGEILPRLETPDRKIRRVILFNGYPSIQCRVDTLFAGAVCPINDGVDVLDNNLYNFSVCSSFQGHTLGLRPRCWYVPRSDDE